MKRFIGSLLILTLLIGMVTFASAATLIPGTLTRNITIHKSGDNPIIPGEKALRQACPAIVHIISLSSAKSIII